MYVLGIETSCDETAASVVKDGKIILSNIIASSLSFHRKYGGIIPEIAFRRQLEAIIPIAQSAIKEAQIKLKDIGLVSVTNGPGLSGSLLVGVAFAKSLSLSLGIPLLGVSHLYSHIYASFLKTQKYPTFTVNDGLLPFVALIVSGGHTSLFYVPEFRHIELIGATQDDACGEAFDKVAKILGLGYPGGPIIERLAKSGNARKIRFHCSGTKKPLDFSFSGIKTAVLYAANGKRLTVNDKQDIAASFQETVIGALIQKSFLACRMKKVNRLVIGGGVAANNKLRDRFCQQAQAEKIQYYFPAKELCLDNAAMVAGLGYKLFKNRYQSDLSLNIDLN
jgi:N6-L-threonylcarbamoyladenine synthase